MSPGSSLGWLLIGASLGTVATDSLLCLLAHGDIESAASTGIQPLFGDEVGSVALGTHQVASSLCGCSILVFNA